MSMSREKLPEAEYQRFHNKYENGLRRLEYLKNCMTQNEYTKRRNKIHAFFFSNDNSGLSKYIDEMEKDLSGAINAHLDAIEKSLREEKNKQIADQEQKKAKADLLKDILYEQAAAKKNYDKLAEICPNKKFFCQKSEEISGNLSASQRRHITLSKQESIRLNSLNAYLENKIARVESGELELQEKESRKHSLMWALFGVILYTRSQLKNSLDVIHPQHVHVESFIICLEYYQKIKKNAFTLFSDNALKLSIAEKLIDLLQYNMSITLTYSELGILVDSTLLSGSLLRKMTRIFYSIKELAGIREAVHRYCVLIDKNCYELNNKIHPEFKIIITQKKCYVESDQEHQYKSSKNCVVS